MQLADAGRMWSLATYVRAYGVPWILNGYIADLLQGRNAMPGPQKRLTREILKFMSGHRLLHQQEVARLKNDPAYVPRFASIRAIQEAAAERFLESAQSWPTIERLETRHKA